MENITNEAQRIKLGWLVKIRYLNCIGALILAVIASFIRFIDANALWAIIFIIFVVVSINFLTKKIWENSRRPISDLTIFFQLLIDLLALSQILIIAGRPAVPLHALYMILAALGALLLSRLTSSLYFLLLFIALAITQYISFDPITLLSASHTKDVFLRLAIFHIPLVVIWIIARSLGNYLEVISEKIINLELQSEKMDRLRAIGALTAGISHEFASPLNIVKLRLNRLFKEIGNNENLLEALEGIERCEQAVRSLNSAQIDHREVESEWIELRDDLEQITVSWGNTKIEIKNYILNNIKLFVPRLNFSATILNFLDNSLQANASLVEVSSRINKKKFELKIIDNGPGIKQEFLNDIGNPFFTTKLEGTGLGIYSSRLFMESIGGGLIVENQTKGTGVVVTLIFPLKFMEEYER